MTISIRKSFFILMSVFGLTFLVAAPFLFYQFVQLKEANKLFYERPFRVSNEVKLIDRNVQKTIADLNSIYSGLGIEELNRLERDVNKVIAQTRSKIEVVSSLFLGDQEQKELISIQFNQLVQLKQEVFRQAKISQLDSDLILANKGLISDLRSKVSEVSEFANAKANEFKSEIDNRVDLIYFIMIGFFTINGALLIWLGVFFLRRLIKPLEEMTYVTSEYVIGNLHIEINKQHDDEIGDLLDNINAIGDNINKAADFAEATGKGELDHEFEAVSDSDVLGISLIDMREKLKKVAEQDKNRTWLNQSIAEFSEILRKDNDNIENLCNNIISYLVERIEAQQGGVFIVNDSDEETPFLELGASYAYGRRKFLQKRIEMNEGLVGQAWKEGLVTYLTDIPSGYTEITSGLGNMEPDSILIVPLVINEQIMGVLELAAVGGISEIQKDFIDKVSEIMASTLRSVQTNIHTAKLLAESQHMQKEMQDQEEAMRQSMEEMRATQEQMEEKERELMAINQESRMKEEQLKQTLDMMQDTQRKVMEGERELKARVKILNEMCVVSETDRKGVITKVNSKFLEVAKYAEHELIGQPHNIVRHPDMPAEVFKLMWQTIGRGEPFRGMVKNRAKDGSVYWVDAVINPIIGEDGKPAGYIGVRYLNTEIIQENETYTYDLGDKQITIPTK